MHAHTAATANSVNPIDKIVHQFVGSTGTEKGDRCSGVIGKVYRRRSKRGWWQAGSSNVIST